MAKAKFKGDAKKRDGSLFALIPRVVLESEAYIGLSGSAVKLLFEFVYQFKGYNNGTLLCNFDMLAQRGWKSKATLARAKDELIESGLICETRKGMMPNRLGWYALTWRDLDVTEGLDIKPSAFPRGAYRNFSHCKNDGLGTVSGPKRGSIGTVSVPRPSPVGTVSVPIEPVSALS